MIVKNFIWDFVGKFGSQVISFAISVILARLLSPEEYGVMGMAMAVIGIANVFIGLGFYRALALEDNVSPVQYDSVFIINTALAIALTVICFILATPLAIYYKTPLIEPVIRALSLTFLFNGLNLIPSVMLYKKLKFKVISIINLIGLSISGIIGVVMAYRGFGVWSLVIQAILSPFIILLVNWFYINWWPSFRFEKTSVKPLWNYGSKLFVSSLMNTTFTRLDAFVIGRVFPSATLGYYVRAQGIEYIVKELLCSSVLNVLFPIIAKNKNDKKYLLSLHQKYLHVISFSTLFLCTLLFVISKELFIFVFSVKWSNSAELFQLMCIGTFATVISALMDTIITGTGNSTAYIRLESIKKFLYIPTYFGFLFGLKGFIVCMAIRNMLAMLLDIYFATKETHYSIVAQLKLILSYVLIGLVSATIVLLLKDQHLIVDLRLKILIYSIVFFVLYVSIAFAFSLKAIKILQDFAYRTLNRNFKKPNIILQD